MSDQPAISPSKSAIRRVWPWAAAVLSGLLLVLCFHPWNQGWLCWIALTPLLTALFSADRSARRFGLRQAGLGFVTGFVFFAGTFWWLASLAGLYRNVYLYSIPALLGVVLGMYFAFWGWFVGALLTRFEATNRFSSSWANLGLGITAASAWIVHEWVRERLFGGFGWNPLSVGLHRDLPMIQIAEFTGAPGISFLLVFVNVMAVIIVRRIIGEFGPVFLKRVRWEFSVTMALVAFVFAFGLRRLLAPETGPLVPVRVAAIQPNIAQEDKFDRSAEEKVLAQIESVTDLALLGQPGPQLILWPESALPSGMFGSQENYRFVINVMQRGDFSLLLGTTDFDPEKSEDYNTALLLSAHGENQQSYRKMHLVPFGEYLPARPLLGPIVGGLVPGDFTPGRDFTLLALPTPAVKLAALVCFEDTVGDLTRRFVLAGAQGLVNITNDGWFGQTPAAEQHLANAALRAVENRRPLIRCGNTGVTCAVLPTGHIERWLPPFEQGFATHEVALPAVGRITFYTAHGDWLTASAAALTLIVGGLAWRKKPTT